MPPEWTVHVQMSGAETPPMLMHTSSTAHAHGLQADRRSNCMCAANVG